MASGMAADSNKTKAILIVDRCGQTRAVLTPFLEEQGYSLTFVADAGAALESLWSGVYCAVLVDTTDPAVGGQGLLEALRRAGAGVAQAVIPFVDADDASSRQRLAAAGFRVSFPKPLDFHVMTNVLADLAWSAPTWPARNSPAEDLGLPGPPEAD